MNYSQDDLWNVYDFVPPKAVKETMQWILDNQVEIAKDNLKGQCTPGNSCKTTSSVKLNELLSNWTASAAPMGLQVLPEKKDLSSFSG
eukprot:CAMPEP_0201971504 /NCGR_PEP_ID=MMETSP0904-20121228/37311_1 /ASSEMBLY_ACC=CAM_ASM_000553 /TAXON_ID=420261 /ORGANISM="Thalassiosira antarctica, Strain CCMP982" /LENGTH=87 /DNA_ID=CAMNT_0048520945 /DNA_START=102 /DNA_END=365 /DNA_ORIENTATION=-